MLTRLGYYADKLLEMGWLAAVVVIPLFFNVYSSRVFEPDKISLLRSLATIMTVLWIVKLAEGGWRAASRSDAPTRMGKVNAAMQGAAESGLPSWLGFLRVPMLLPILVYALIYLVTSIFTLTPDATWFGSYQRLQGTYSQYSYMMVGIIVLANMRSRKQVDRLINFIILTSIPVALYGLLQAVRLDPLPWAGDTSSRVASSMGNAIFVAAWLIMTVPLTLYRLINGISSTLAAHRVGQEPEAVDGGDGRRRVVRRTAYTGPDYSWAVIANAIGLLTLSMLVFMSALRMVAGLPFPDAALWWAVPFGLVVFYAVCWAIEWINNRRDDSNQPLYMAGIGALIFLVGIFAVVIEWTIDTKDLTAQIKKFDWSGFFLILFILLAIGSIAGLAYAFGGTAEENSVRRVGLVPVVINVLYEIVFIFLQPDAGLRSALWALFFIFAWAALAALAYFFGARDEESQDARSGIGALALNTGYGILLAVQLLCIYLTQSRGPWLGVGAGLVVFALALWLLGRSQGIRWMSRIGGTASALVLAGAIFVGALNIPNSPLTSLTNLPVIGRGVERLSTLTQTDTGTGKVRELIWQGATNLIISDPLRTIIGYGPESMYVVYNKFYPADLAHWELRNATPDRSHNVEFDHLVTMGVVGLAGYYFIVGAFFLFGLRIIKRARNTHDQLFGIALISTMVTHFIEIQTGIQIASTWTYFYLLIGVIIAFGYYVTGYLRDVEPAVATEPLYTDGAGAANGAVAVPTGATASGARQPVLASSTASRGPKSVVTMSTGGNGKPSAAGGAVPRNAGRTDTPTNRAQQGRDGGASTGQGRNGGQMSEARRRQAQMQARVQPEMSEGEWSRNPLFMIVYAVLLAGAFVFAWKINVATVQADTYYKQGQSRDNAARYLTDNHDGSIDYYSRAIDLQPNQDYYYLFRGRAYLEFSKTIEQQVPQGTTQAKIDDFRTQYLGYAQDSLLRARELNPLNTDHYANLGRLYLYWADPTGGKKPELAPKAVSYMEQATDHSPGNAQLWDELAVAYSRNNQFDKAIEALRHSQHDVDNTYARTPFIRGQLLQDRASAVKNALSTGGPLPTGGENDYTKLLIEASQAFSDSITLDPANFVDNGMQGRVDYFLTAADPFTDVVHHTVVNPVQLRNLLTDTISLAYQQMMPAKEKQVADFLRGRGVYKSEANMVPANVLDGLWAKQDWAGIRPAGSTKEWLDNDFLSLAHAAVVPYAALGYIQFKLYDPAATELTPARQKLLAEATDSYRRAVTLDPSNYFNQKNLGSLLIEQGQHLFAAKSCPESQAAYDDGLNHLQAGLGIVSSQPDAQTDPNKKNDLGQIQGDVQRAQGLKAQACP